MSERTYNVIRGGVATAMTFAQLRAAAPRDLTDDGLRHRIWRLEKRGPIPYDQAIEPRSAAKMRSPWRNTHRRVA